VPRFVTGTEIVELEPVTLIVAPARLITEEPGLVRIEAPLTERLELLSSVAPPESWMVLPEFRVAGPKLAKVVPVIVSVPLTVNPAFALTPAAPPMLEVPDDVKRPLRVKLPALLRVEPVRPNAFRSVELAATVSEVGTEVLLRMNLLAAVRLWTDCWLLESTTKEPANGVSMQTSSDASGALPRFQFNGENQLLSTAPVH